MPSWSNTIHVELEFYRSICKLEEPDRMEEEEEDDEAE